jgi:hypothetical protein
MVVIRIDQPRDVIAPLCGDICVDLAVRGTSIAIAVELASRRSGTDHAASRRSN